MSNLSCKSMQSVLRTHANFLYTLGTTISRGVGINPWSTQQHPAYIQGMKQELLRAARMTKLALSAVVLLLSSLLAVSSALSVDNDDFDLFFFVQQWPGSLCDSTKGCCFQDTGKAVPEFGIHGLWPQYATCRYVNTTAAALNILDSTSTVGKKKKKKKKCWPENCDKNDTLELLQIKDLLASLERDWPTLSCKNGATNMDFWGHEWQKHGTCSGYDQHSYFQQGLELKAAHNLTAILADAGILPSDTATYFLSGAKDAISEATGFDAILQCNRNTDGEAQLYQVYLCVARDGSGLVDCPAPLLRNCADKIKFPAF